MKTILVMSAANASSERSFSALRRLKTWLKSTMSQTLLNWCMISHVHTEETDELDLLKSLVHELLLLGIQFSSLKRFYLSFYLIIHIERKEFSSHNSSIFGQVNYTFSIDLEPFHINLNATSFFFISYTPADLISAWIDFRAIFFHII